MRLFIAEGFERTTMRRIAEEVEYAPGALYQYFEDKRDLFLYLLDAAVNQRRLDAMHAAQPQAAQHGFFEQLRWMLRGSVQAALAHPQLARIALRAYGGDLPFSDEALERGRAMGRAYIRGLVVQGIAAASQDQAAGVAQINGAMGALNQATQQNSAASEELAATAEEMNAQAEQLQQLMAFFQLKQLADSGGHTRR